MITLAKDNSSEQFYSDSPIWCLGVLTIIIFVGMLSGVLYVIIRWLP